MNKRGVLNSRADFRPEVLRPAPLNQPCASRSTGRALNGRALSAWIVLGAIGAAGVACSPQAWAITDKEEAQMAQSMGVSLEDRMGGSLPASDPMSQRVERIGKRFAHLAHHRSFGYRYRVLRNTTILNAFAAPGGTIYITSRLVKFTRSEDELASILGHETAHVSQRHIAQEIDERNAFVRFSERLAELRREAAQDSNGSKASKASKKADMEK